MLENNGIGANGGYKLGDEIVTKAASQNGVQIGYDKIDGNIPGCYEYASYVTIRVKAVFDTDYIIEQKVRKAGTSTWSYTLEDAKVGDKVEYQIQYKNTSKDNQTHTDVMIKDILPQNMKYVAGSTKLYNSNHPNGATVNQDTIVTTGINIGSYAKDSNAYVRFTAEVVDKNLANGSNTLVNWAQGGVGQKTIQDYTSVVLNKVADTPNNLPNTGPEALAGGIIAAGSVATAAGYYIVSRRSMR